jgi:hypothetical protein
MAKHIVDCSLEVDSVVRHCAVVLKTHLRRFTNVSLEIFSRLDDGAKCRWLRLCLAGCPYTYIFRDELSLVSGKARRGDGTPVDEEQRRMKPKSIRPFGLRRQHPICGVGPSRRGSRLGGPPCSSNTDNTTRTWRYPDSLLVPASGSQHSY